MTCIVTLLCGCLLLAGTAFVATSADRPPSNVRQVCSVSEDTYLLRWDSPTEEDRTVTSYTLQLNNGRMVTTGNGQTELVVVGDRASFPVNISGVETPFGFLTHFTSYSVRVSASYGSDSSDFSESGIFRTPTYFPSRLDAPIVDILGPSVLRLRWSPPTYVNGPDLRYTIRIIPDLEGPQIDAIVVRTTQTSVVLRDLCHATHIGASIIPSSGFTTEFTQGITPEVDMPTSSLAPTNVITSNNVSSTIEGRNMFVSWDPPMEGVDNETRYVVEATCSTESTFDDGLPCENPPRLDTPNTDGVIIGLLPGRKYFIRVRALRNGVLSAPACAVNTASIGAPPSPSLVSVTVIDSTSVSLDVQNGFDVVVALHVRINGALRQFDAPIGPVTLSGLTPETNYQIEVAVQNFEGVGPYSEPITVNTRTNNDLLNAVQNFRLHFPRGSSVLSMYLSWEPPINEAGILGYSVYLNDEIFTVGLEQFYEFTISPDAVYTASVCYEGASPCYHTSMLQFKITQDLVRSVNASAFVLSGNYTVDLVPINSSAIFVFFSPPINNCNGLEHLSGSGFITDLGDIEPLVPVPPLAEGTQSYIQTGLNASTRYFFYSLRLRANYTKTISGQRLTSARTMDGAPDPSGAQCAAEMVNGVSWPTTTGNQNSIVSFEREGCPVILMRFCGADGQWRPVEEQLNPCGLSGAQLIPPPTESTSAPTTGTTTNPNSTESSAPTTGTTTNPNSTESSAPTTGTTTNPNSTGSSAPTTGTTTNPNSTGSSAPTTGTTTNPNSTGSSAPTTGTTTNPNSTESSAPTTGTTTNPNSTESSAPTTGTTTNPNSTGSSAPTTGTTTNPNSTGSSAPTTGTTTNPNSTGSSAPTTGTTTNPNSTGSSAPTTGTTTNPNSTGSSAPTTGTTTNPNSTGSSAIPSTSVVVLVTSLGACLLYIKAVIL